MAETAIRVSGVSKTFRIYDHPGDRLKEAFSLRRKSFHTDFPALTDVSFEVARGEFLGIVGRNGAGKSTLLKLLSRELTPSSGSVHIDGKVSLLQLGVGFDPELTGIENARFATKLLGYTERQTEAMLEDVVAFADIGEFVHHPVRTYSSGMYSRLSFAVGINIDPDILIADEVLSVGDMRFSQKCLRKMRQFKDAGKTVIFVSHDIQSVNQFCDTAMWLMDGRIYMQGNPKSVTTSFQNYMLYDKLPNEYAVLGGDAADLSGEGAEIAPAPSPASTVAPATAAQSDVPADAWIGDLARFPSVGDGRVEIRRMAFLLEQSLVPVATLQGNERVVLLMDISIRDHIETGQVGWVLYDRLGATVLHTNNEICSKVLPELDAGSRVLAEFRFRLPSLASGNYMFSIGLQSRGEMPHKIDDVYQFTVARTDAKAAQCGYVIIEDESCEISIFR
jgi:ABC-type polysaccharide/polyol phosphate transport system ATPase subunit